MNTEQFNVPFTRTAMKWGAIMGFGSILVSMLFYFFTGKMDTQNSFQTVISIGIYIAGIIFCIKEQRDELQQGYISFGRATGVSMLTVICSALISGVFTYAFLKFGDPGLIENMITQTEEKLREDGQSDEQIEMAIEMTRKIMQPGFLTFSAIFMSALIGLVPSLIIAAIMKKEPQTGF
jgi:hypothetical protein